MSNHRLAVWAREDASSQQEHAAALLLDRAAPLNHVWVAWEFGEKTPVCLHTDLVRTMHGSQQRRREERRAQANQKKDAPPPPQNNNRPIRKQHKAATRRPPKPAVKAPRKRVVADSDRPVSNKKRPTTTQPSIDNDDEWWSVMFGLLQSHVERHGSCVVPESEVDLCQWIQQQQCRRLSDARVEQLASIGFWEDRHASGNTKTAPRQKENDILWQNMFSRLQAYHARNGDCQVPHGCPDQKLRNWVKQQRYRYREGTLVPQRRQQLQSLGFVFVTSSKGSAKSGAAIQRSAKQKPPPSKRKPPPPTAANERDTKGNQKRQQPVSQTRNMHNDKRWLENFEKLKEYHRKNGNANVPWNYADDKKLVNWCKWQRRSGRDGSMPAHRRERLLSLDFSFALEGSAVSTRTVPTTRDHSEGKKLWLELFARLELYFQRTGHSNVTKRCDPRLAHWIKWQRKAKQEGKLPADREEMLRTLNFSWIPADSATGDKLEINEPNQSEKQTAEGSNVVLSRESYVHAGESLFFGKYKHIPDKVQLIDTNFDEYKSFYSTGEDLVPVGVFGSNGNE